VIVVPAVDIRDGRVVRLKQGRLQEELVYGSDPVDAARRFQDQGAERIHVVDLDAALGGRPQTRVIEDVILALRVKVEVGGGLRTLEAAVRYRERGADRVIFGTAVISDPGVVQEALKRFPEAVAVALDARAGRVTVAGWQESTTVSALELAERVKGWGVSRVQYTDIVRDGTLSGPNLEGTRELAERSGLRITASGGVSSLEDLARLSRLPPAVDEVIVGKALYEGRFTLAAAQAAVRG
jgi:phosphoribosylformimino-5-aminoimidazole carboxamide ribotide isomerase